MIKVDVRSSTPSSLVPDPMSFATPQKAVVKDKGNGYSCPFCTSCFAHCSTGQWINTTATRSGVKFSYPISMNLYAQTITHNGSTPGATGIENQTAYDNWSTTQAAPVWIIAIGK